MGRDWSWLGGGKKKTTSKSKKDIKSTPPFSSPSGNTATAATGCMSAVFNIFDLQHSQFPINHHHLHLPKDAEETPCSPTRKDGNLNISMGIKIKTKPQATSSSLAATESYSPSVKTPTLVARLMGLEPESPTLSSSHTSKHRHYSLQRNSVDGGTRSLPETPRISLGRRSVDVNSYQHQRSSLHLREMKIHVEDKENRSPRDYARQIVMQLKENVRRMGTDITNREQRSREVQEPRKASKITNVAPKIMKIQEELQGGTEQGEKQSKSATKRKKAENFKSRLAKPPQKMQEEPFVRSPPEIKNKDSSNLQQQKTEQVCNDEKQSKSATKRKKAENFKSRLVKPPRTLQEELFVRSSTTSNNKNIGNKDSSKLRVMQSSRNRASTEFTTFQSQTQTHVSPITKRTLILVDDLVAGEFPETVTQSELTFEEEGDGIVRELERGIFESLVTETTTDCFDTWIKRRR